MTWLINEFGEPLRVCNRVHFAYRSLVGWTTLCHYYATTIHTDDPALVTCGSCRRSFAFNKRVEAESAA